MPCRSACAMARFKSALPSSLRPCVMARTP
jgi:hypothetical protein